MKLLAILLFWISVANSQKDPHWWENRSVMVHLFEWKWKDIADECERFLQHKGYGGVQISPANENLIVAGRPWWERYQQMSFKLVTRSGNEEEFLDMTTRCNKVGIRIYVDVILNHMTANADNPVGIAGSTADTYRKYYPAVPFTKEHFHETCEIVDFLNVTQGRDCELVALHDLNQTLPYVREKLIEFLDHLIHLGVAGFRVDAARHMSPDDLKYIYENLQNLNTSFGFAENSRAFIYQEVSGFEGKIVLREEYTPMGRVTEFRHAQKIGEVFGNGNQLEKLNNWGNDWLPSDSAFVFVDNHDMQRSHADQGILMYKNAKKYIMATAFMLSNPYGSPRIMSSFDFENRNQGPPHNDDETILSPKINPDETCGNGWICEHRWPEISNMINFRNLAKNTNVTNFWSNGNQASFCRGNLAFIAFSSRGNMDEKLQTCLPAGKYCDIITGNKNSNGTCTGKMVQVQNDGFALIQIGENEKNGVLAIHLESKL